MTPDGRPILGRVPGLEGFFVASGCCVGGCACFNSGCVSGSLRSQRTGLLYLGQDQVWAWYRQASNTLVSIFFRYANRN